MLSPHKEEAGRDAQAGDAEYISTPQIPVETWSPGRYDLDMVALGR